MINLGQILSRLMYALFSNLFGSQVGNRRQFEKYSIDQPEI